MLLSPISSRPSPIEHYKAVGAGRVGGILKVMSYNASVLIVPVRL